MGKYQTNVLPRLDEVKQWCKNGVSEKVIASNLGIAESTFHEYKKKYPEFLECLKKGKAGADEEVENALFKKACGYNAKIKKTFKCKVVEYDDYGKKVREEEILKEAFDEVHVSADTTAQIFWLKNRMPERWKDKVDASAERDKTSPEKVTIEIVGAEIVEVEDK